jgi:hypothetical protein
VRDRNAQLGTVAPMLEKLTRAAASTLEAKKAWEAALADCEKKKDKKCKSTKAAEQSAAVQTNTFVAIKAEMDEYTTRPEVVAEDAKLGERDEALDQRLHSLCGRPPRPKEN